MMNIPPRRSDSFEEEEEGDSLHQDVKINARERLRRLSTASSISFVYDEVADSFTMGSTKSESCCSSSSSHSSSPSSYSSDHPDPDDYSCTFESPTPTPSDGRRSRSPSVLSREYSYTFDSGSEKEGGIELLSHSPQSEFYNNEEISSVRRSSSAEGSWVTVTADTWSRPRSSIYSTDTDHSDGSSRNSGGSISDSSSSTIYDEIEAFGDGEENEEILTEPVDYEEDDTGLTFLESKLRLLSTSYRPTPLQQGQEKESRHCVRFCEKKNHILSSTHHHPSEDEGRNWEDILSESLSTVDPVWLERVKLNNLIYTMDQKSKMKIHQPSKCSSCRKANNILQEKEMRKAFLETRCQKLIKEKTEKILEVHMLNLTDTVAIVGDFVRHLPSQNLTGDEIWTRIGARISELEKAKKYNTEYSSTVILN